MSLSPFLPHYRGQGNAWPFCIPIALWADEAAGILATICRKSTAQARKRSRRRIFHGANRRHADKKKSAELRAPPKCDRLFSPAANRQSDGDCPEDCRPFGGFGNRRGEVVVFAVYLGFSEFEPVVAHFVAVGIDKRNHLRL